MGKPKVSKVIQEKFDVVWWPIERCKPYKQNARKITDRAIDKVAASLKEFGWRQPIVCEPDGTILAGHTRWMIIPARGGSATTLKPASSRSRGRSDPRNIRP